MSEQAHSYFRKTVEASRQLAAGIEPDFDNFRPPFLPELYANFPYRVANKPEHHAVAAVLIDRLGQVALVGEGNDSRFRDRPATTTPVTTPFGLTVETDGEAKVTFYTQMHQLLEDVNEYWNQAGIRFLETADQGTRLLNDRYQFFLKQILEEIPDEKQQEAPIPQEFYDPTVNLGVVFKIITRLSEFNLQRALRLEADELRRLMLGNISLAHRLASKNSVHARLIVENLIHSTTQLHEPAAANYGILRYESENTPRPQCDLEGPTLRCPADYIVSGNSQSDTVVHRLSAAFINEAYDRDLLDWRTFFTNSDQR